MKVINTEIQIEASKDKVWKIICDLPGWSQWNPIVNKIEGELSVGSTLSITMSNSKGKDAQKYKGTITTFEKEKQFIFIAKMMANFLFSVERVIEIKESRKGTLLTQIENYKGIMVTLFWGKLDTMARKMLNAMNKALKEKAEMK